MPIRPARKTLPKGRPSARAKAPSAAPKLSKKSARKAVHADRMKAALLALRSTLKEIQEQYSVRTNGLLLQMMQIVDPPRDAGEPPALPSRKTMEQMLETIKALKVKPKKGRSKDLQRVQDLLEALWIQFPPQP